MRGEKRSERNVFWEEAQAVLTVKNDLAQQCEIDIQGRKREKREREIQQKGRMRN